ncbi:MAG: hypothetical protein ABR597_07850 [Bacteroidales bacterium]
MKNIRVLRLFSLFFVFYFINMGFLRSQSQPEVLNEGTLQEQYEYLNERTNIYNNYRAIREDMFQKVRRNSIDSLNQAYNEIQNQIQLKEQAIEEKDAMAVALAETEVERDQAIRDRDSLFLFGIPLSKTFYNVLLWSIIIVLAVLAVIVFFMYFRSNRITRQKTKDLNELQDEFDEYRKTSRERFEQQSIDHFNELKRLKGI